MFKGNFLHQTLYTGAWLVILVTILFPIASILYLILDKSGAATPESGIIGTLVFVILHLLILYGFREAIIANKRNGRLTPAVYIISGIGLLLFGLLILQIAIEFLGYDNFYLLTIAFFFCCGCDFFAAIIAFAALILQPKKRK